jgi:hypothetical protein
MLISKLLLISKFPIKIYFKIHLHNLYLSLLLLRFKSKSFNIFIKTVINAIYNQIKSVHLVYFYKCVNFIQKCGRTIDNGVE